MYKEASLKKAKSAQKEPVTVSLWIDSYTDLFSDFDPRSFESRAFSDDFVGHMKKVSKDDKGTVSVVKILVPEGVRHSEDESVISKRLEGHFFNVHQKLKEESNAIKKKGMYFTLSGIVLMVLASYISFLQLTSFYYNLLLVLFEPGGWFLFWTGLDNLITYSKSKKSEIDFYSRMSHAHVEFGSYK